MAKKRILLGVGGGNDGHKRITRGDDMIIVGGTKESHEFITEKAIKFTEEVKKRGRNIDTLRPGDIREIFEKLN